MSDKQERKKMCRRLKTILGKLLEAPSVELGSKSPVCSRRPSKAVRKEIDMELMVLYECPDCGNKHLVPLETVREKFIWFCDKGLRIDMPVSDLCALAYYMLTNTNLLLDDPRIEFMKAVKRLKEIQGFGEPNDGAKRLGIS